jgi:hypothetical protein
MAKFALKSMTIQGAIVFAIAFILSKFNIEIESAAIENFVEAALGVIGFVMIIVGRWNAKHSLTLKK